MVRHRPKLACCEAMPAATAGATSALPRFVHRRVERVGEGGRGAGVGRQRRAQGAGQRLARAVEAGVLVERRLGVGDDPIAIRLAQEGRRHREVPAIGGGQAAAVRLLQPHQQTGGPLVRLRQRQQRHVHRVVAVQVGVEDQVGRVAGMRGHRPEIGEQVRVRRDGGVRRRAMHRLTGRGPLLADGLDPHVPALATGQAVRRELQAFADRRVGGGQRRERGIDPLARGLQLARACRGLPHEGIREPLVVGDGGERRHEAALVVVAIELAARERDVLVQVDQRQHRGQRQREDRGEQQQAPRRS